MNLADSYYFIARLALDLAGQQPPERRKQMAKSRWLREFRTMRVQGQRGSGHTEAVAKLAASLGSGVLVISPYHHHFELTHRYGLKVAGIQQERDFEVRLRGKAPEVVLVDGASFYTPTQVDLLYEYLSDNENVFFIFLG